MYKIIFLKNGVFLSINNIKLDIEYIRSQIGLTGLNSVQQSVLERIIHSSGDLSMQSYLRFSSNACEDAINALKTGANIWTDTYMAEAAVSSVSTSTSRTTSLVSVLVSLHEVVENPTNANAATIITFFILFLIR